MGLTEYQDVPGFPGYKVGNDGSVWTEKYTGGNWAKPRRTGEWKRLKPSRVGKYGHQLVQFRNRGKSRLVLVHRLVLELFVGPCPPGMECRHLDGNPANNHLENLRWGTSAENSQDMIRHGRSYHKPGEADPGALLTEKQVREIIRIRASEGIGYCKIARRLGIEKKWAVHSVIYGYSWNHITGLPRTKHKRERGSSV